MYTDIIILHVTALAHNELMTKMPDAIWSHLDTMIELCVA